MVALELKSRESYFRMLECRIMVTFAGTTYWNEWQGNFCGTAFLNTDVNYISVLIFWKFIKLYTWFVLFCIHVIHQLKFLKPNEQADSSNPYIASVNYHMSLSSSLIIANFLNFVYSLPLFLHLLLNPPSMAFCHSNSPKQLSQRLSNCLLCLVQRKFSSQLVWLPNNI